MRLTTEQITIIKQKTALIFGDDTKIYLFGSRTDDNAKGGDIDLFIGIIFHAPPYNWKPIHTEAKEHGILL